MTTTQESVAVRAPETGDADEAVIAPERAIIVPPAVIALALDGGVDARRTAQLAITNCLNG